MSAELGGIEKSLITFLDFLVKMNCEVDLLLWKKKGELLGQIPHQVKLIDSPSAGNLKTILKNKRVIDVYKYSMLKFFSKIGKPWKSFPKLKDTYDIAVSYTQDGYSPYYVIDNVKASKKILWYHHGEYVYDSKKWKKDINYYECFNNIVTVSESNKKMLEIYFKDIADKISVIQNLLDEKNIIKESEEKCIFFDKFSGCKITTVGRLSVEKGQLETLALCKKLKDEQFDFKWCFVGDGPLRNQCETLVKEYSLENHCFFVGAKKNPYKYVANSDIYVQLSKVEADPVTIQEALILKKLIIGSSIPAIQEALFYGKLGKICYSEEDAISSIKQLNIDVNLQKEYLKNIEQYESRNKKIESLLYNILFL